VPEYDDRIAAEPVDPEALLHLSDRWGLRSSINRVLGALQQASA
jgi:hypothetical protein